MGPALAERPKTAGMRQVKRPAQANATWLRLPRKIQRVRSQTSRASPTDPGSPEDEQGARNDQEHRSDCQDDRRDLFHDWKTNKTRGSFDRPIIRARIDH